MKTTLKAGMVALAVMTATTTTASAETYAQKRAEESAFQVAKRVFRLGNRAWKIVSLAGTIGMTAVEAHAKGYSPQRTGAEIASDVADEVIETVGDAAYVVGYVGREVGSGVIALIDWALD